MVSVISDTKRCVFENAIDLTGFGKYNITMLVTCGFLILAMYTDIFGFSIIMPAVACDMVLNTSQQGLLSAVPLLGVMISSYIWGLAADTIGRRVTLLIAMPIGFLLNIAASMAATYTALAVLKFFSATFTSAANAAAYVLMAESVPKKQRSRFMCIMAAVTMFMQFAMCCCALPVFKMKFQLTVYWLNLKYRPWRLLMQIISLPGAIGTLYLVFLKESPKFLLSKQRHEEALLVLRTIFHSNTRHRKAAYSVTQVYLDETLAPSTETSILKKIWNQTAPLFKPPLLKNSAILYYLLLCAFMTSTGYTMWVPTMTNVFFTGEDHTGHTFCEVASRSTKSTNTTTEDCDNIIQPATLYAVMWYSGLSTILAILLSFLADPFGKKLTTLIIFVITIFCGIALLFVKIPLLSIALFYIFLYVNIILGNVNTFLVELNPTHLRGMATCLSVVVARGFGFFSVQIIASLLENHCTPMICGYVVLVISGLLVATLLPPDSKSKKSIDVIAKISTTTKL